jgi:hypothetical protein
LDQSEPRSRRMKACVLALLLLGLGLRAYHYVRNPSIWHDEAVVFLSILDRGYSDLLGPLAHNEGAPPLFLFIEKAVQQTLGEQALAWRLFPFLASCAALILMVPATRVLPPAARLWALFLFACSDRILWHSCEAKPYTVDLFVAVGLLVIFQSVRSWPLWSQLLLYAALAPVLIFLSYPACFLCGGIVVACLPGVWRERRKTTWLAYLALVVAIAGSFALLFLGPVRAQRSHELINYWTRQLPDWDHPASVPRWVLTSTFEMLRYCWKPSGGLFLPLACLGAILLWRNGQRRLVAFLGVPILLALAASCLEHYPYGHTRTMLYALPAVTILVCAAIPPSLVWLRERSRAAAVPLLLLLLAPLALSCYRLVDHWIRPDSAGATAYVLAHRDPQDHVAGTHWEHEYYFRKLGSLFSYAHHAPEAGRCWVVSEGEEAVNRRKHIEAMCASGWHVLEENNDFEWITVFLLVHEQTENTSREHRLSGL